MITVTSLTHPVMIAKIRTGLRKAACNKGHELGGHGKRVYIQNSKGHNIMRIDWLGYGKPNGPFVAYGGADWGRTDVTDIVKAALKRSNAPVIQPSDKAVALVKSNPTLAARLMRLAGLLALVLLVMAPNEPAFADRPPTPLESACIKQPDLLVCTWAYGENK